MKNIIKKLKNNSLFTFILGIIVCSGVVYGVNIYSANDIEYTTDDGTKTNVNEALNDLYDIMNNIEQDRDWRAVVEFTTYLTSNGYSTSSPKGTRVYSLTLEHIDGNTTLKETHSGFAHINGELYGTPAAFCENFKVVSFKYLD